jgi:hypothetical protein
MGEPEPSDRNAGEDDSWPIGFIALLVAGGLYLLFRFVGLAADFIGWLTG